MIITQTLHLKSKSEQIFTVFNEKPLRVQIVFLTNTVNIYFNC